MVWYFLKKPLTLTTSWVPAETTCSTSGSLAKKKRMLTTIPKHDMARYTYCTCRGCACQTPEAIVMLRITYRSKRVCVLSVLTEFTTGSVANRIKGADL